MRVFISHAASDHELAKRLGRELGRFGLDVWNAGDEIFPGDNWAKKIGQALEESDVMIAVVTRNSLATGPLQEDIQFALTSKNYGGRVIPLLVNCTTFVAGEGVPWILLRLKPIYIDSAASDLQEVVDRVRALAEPASHA